MDYINLTPYINYKTILTICVSFNIIGLFIALWYDCFYKEQSKELSMNVDRRVFNSISEIYKNKSLTYENPSFITGEEYELIIEQSEKRESENKLTENKHQVKKEQESYKPNWVWSQFQFVKKLNKTSNPIIRKILFLEEKKNEKITFEMEKTYVNIV